MLCIPEHFVSRPDTCSPPLPIYRINIYAFSIVLLFLMMGLAYGSANVVAVLSVSNSTCAMRLRGSASASMYAIFSDMSIAL